MTAPSKPFAVGDKVKAFGVNGVVTHVDEMVTVRFPLKEHYRFADDYFFLDGKEYPWHLRPSLKHRRFKKRGPREIWVNVYKCGRISAYLSSDRANSSGFGSPGISENAVRFIRAKK